METARGKERCRITFATKPALELPRRIESMRNFSARVLMIMLILGSVRSVTPLYAAEAVISEKQARRAAHVTILKTQFRQTGGFTSDQLSGFYTALQLSNEINIDIKRESRAVLTTIACAV